MRMGQRYNVHTDDKTIHFIDPAGEHVLVPKNREKSSRSMQRRNSDSDIPRNQIQSRNKNNVKLDPIDHNKAVDANKGIIQ